MPGNCKGDFTSDFKQIEKAIDKYEIFQLNQANHTNLRQLN